MAHGERRPGAEVLRNLSMFAIVLYHCQMFGLWAWQPHYWCDALHAPLMWHVPAFAAISGWFGIRFSWLKFLRVLGIIFFYSAVAIVYQGGRLKIDAGWYGGTYLGLMLVSPILNAAADSLCRRGGAKALSALGLFALMLFFNWLPRHGFTACAPRGVGGMTLVMLSFFFI